MSQQLINHNVVLKKLQNNGFEIEVRDGYLLVHHVPYLTSETQLNEGTLIMSLSLSGNVVLKPSDHTAYWIGEKPHYKDGTQVTSLINREENSKQGGFTVNFFLSCKPEANGGNYVDYYEKVETYFHTISDPAFSLYPEKSKELRKPIVPYEDNSNLIYADTNASRSNITEYCEKFKDDKIAIIGLGGTGAYLIDHLSKTPVAEIHLYDDDEFNSHNAFRAPGAASIDQLNLRLKKVEYLKGVYEKMHKGLITHDYKITRDNLTELDKMDFVFICVDSVSVRNMIADHLILRGISFIDSGMGLYIRNNSLDGQVRVTTGTPQHYDHIKEVFGSQVEDENDYATNIQISELNNLAAIIMVIRWKELKGFYSRGQHNFYNAVYCLSYHKILLGNEG